MSEISNTKEPEFRALDVVKECPLTHSFSDKVYIREVFMPKGSLIVGKVHKTRHFNIVLTGECEVLIGGEYRRIKAPCTFESLEGSQKTLYIYEDCRWATVHVNEDNETDLNILEERYIESELLTNLKKEQICHG